MNDIKIKHILKKFLIFGIAVLLVSCSEELFEEQLAQQNKLTVKEQSFSELVKDKKFNRLMRTLSGLQQVSRSAFENQNGFTISTAPVKVIETDSLTSYTMQILCDNPVDNISLYNLVLQEDILNNQKAVVYKYTPISISSTTHNSFHFDGTIDKFSLGYSTQMNRASQQNITMSDCYDYILMCNYGGTEHPAGVNCTRTYVKKFKVICATPPFDGGFGDTGGGGGGANENPSEENNDIVTTPVLTTDNQSPKDPCVQLNLSTQKTAFKYNLKTLLTSNNNNPYNAGREYGFGNVQGQVNVQWLEPAPNNPTSSLAPVPGLQNFTHIHPNKIIDDGVGEPYDSGVKMFSPGDFEILLGSCYNNNQNPTDAYAIMLSQDMHYSMALTEPLTNDEWGVLNQNITAFRENYLKKAGDIIYVPDIEQRNKALQKMMLEEINKLGISHKFALFKGTLTNENISPTFSWTRITLTNGTLNDQPCN